MLHDNLLSFHTTKLFMYNKKHTKYYIIVYSYIEQLSIQNLLLLSSPSLPTQTPLYPLPFFLLPLLSSCSCSFCFYLAPSASTTSPSASDHPAPSPVVFLLLPFPSLSPPSSSPLILHLSFSTSPSPPQDD